MALFGKKDEKQVRIWFKEDFGLKRERMAQFYCNNKNNQNMVCLTSVHENISRKNSILICSCT